MKTMKGFIWYFFFLLFCFEVSAQSTDSLMNKLTHYVNLIDNFSRNIPQEKIYLHFDNTSYYQGDNIWFKCYMVTSELNQASNLSKTMYVELLNPGGEVIDKQILKIENSQCHGSFVLNKLPFYSGFYEVRAYTKYMLNFGEDVIFSRLLPVFDKPKEEGNFEEKNMLKYSYGNYPMKREKPQKEKKVTIMFFPEGGNLIQNMASQVAFEATDAYGNPIEVTGAVINEAKEEITRFAAIHNGRGVFTYTPVAEKQKAVVYYKDKKYQFDMPVALPQGVVLKVDNLSYPDSMDITLQKSKNTPAEILGMAVISKGKPYNFYLVSISGDKEVRFKADKTILPPGVSWIVLFNSNGKIVGDRLLFINNNELLNIKLKAEKETYKPYELVNMEFNITNKAADPVQSTFSLSVRDDMNKVKSEHNILTDLLLMSEIKGYVHNPSYYFEADDQTHRTALDLLLMTQGWRRYSWEQITAETDSCQLKYKPEQGIETQGQVVSFVRSKPKANVEISSFLLKRGEDEEAGSLITAFETDSMGRFSFVSDIYGKWNMILAVTEKGKKKDHRIILDRLFSPAPKRYQYAEMQVNITDTEEEVEKETTDKEVQDIPEEDIEPFLSAYEDSLSRKGINEKVHRLKEVTVKAKKRSKEKDIYNNRAKSIAYYDVHSELDDIKDRNKYIGDDIHELMINMNDNFNTVVQRDYLFYKGKKPLFVVDYEPTMQTEMDYYKYKLIRLDAIKSIYINENLSTICKYADPRMSPLEVDDTYRCVVFIETYPEGMIPAEAGKGVRKTWLEGYSQVKEFYSPDYSLLPHDVDYRHTLYWNPSVTPDKEGKAKIQFYNNSRCSKFKVSAETITPQGVIGIYEH